jgi:hypothetical protein
MIHEINIYFDGVNEYTGNEKNGNLLIPSLTTTTSNCRVKRHLPTTSTR